MMGPPLFSLALILRALSFEEPLGVRDAEAVLAARTARAIRFSTAIYLSVPAMVSRGFIVPTAKRAHPMTCSPVQPYRRTDLGVRASAVYAAALRALYSLPQDQGRRAQELGLAVLAFPTPVTTAAIALEFLRSANMTATQVAHAFLRRFGLPSMRVARFGHVMRPLARLGLAEVVCRSSKEILYKLTPAGRRRAEDFRTIVSMLYGGAAPAPEHGTLAEEGGDGPITERDPKPWHLPLPAPIGRRRASHGTHGKVAPTARQLADKRVEVEALARDKGYPAEWVEQVLAVLRGTP